MILILFRVVLLCFNIPCFIANQNNFLYKHDKHPNLYKGHELKYNNVALWLTVSSGESQIFVNVHHGLDI